jgi:outer membrane lipoprotein SlyB
MTGSTSLSPEPLAPGAVPRPSANPIVWWVAGGLSLLGVGALAAALMNSPKEAATPVPAAKAAATKTVAAKAAPAAKPPAAVACAHCGTVESVKAEKQKGEATGLGAVGGAVVGGVVGHQVGNGNGKKAMTVLGAVGGGLAGHEIEKHARSTTVYQVQLRMDDGSTRTVTQTTAPAVGARVEVQGNELKPRPAKG